MNPTSTPTDEWITDRPRRSGHAILARAMVLGRAPHKEVTDLQDRRDRHLIEQCARGDESAFSELFRLYGAASFGLANRILVDRGLAEEVLQEVFLAVWMKAAGYDRARGSVRSWVLTQIHHRSVDIVRREEAGRRRNAAQLPSMEQGPMQDDVVEEDWLAHRRDAVRAAMTSLPVEQQEVIELAYFQGLTQTQVATRIDAPLGTVKSRTLAAMRRLRRALLANGEGDQ